jgi:hypothetical protein
MTGNESSKDTIAEDHAADLPTPLEVTRYKRLTLA